MKYVWSKENSSSLLKVLAWTMASAIVASLITFVGNLEVAPRYLYIVSIVNTILYAVKEWVSGKR